MEERISTILDREINPKLLEHDGWVEFVDYEANEVTLRFRGACSGCGANDVTLEETIKPVLFRELPELKSVVITEEVSQLLYDMACSILKKA